MLSDHAFLDLRVTLGLADEHQVLVLQRRRQAAADHLAGEDLGGDHVGEQADRL